MTRFNVNPFRQLGSCFALMTCLAASSTLIGCMGTAAASADVAAPAPGLVAVEPDVWVVGDASAPEAYYSDGYYWEVEGDHWYRRPNPQVAWVIVETRVVPRRVIVHEHEHHTAIVAHHRPLTNVEARREKQADARERATEQQARERIQDAEERQRAADEARERHERHEAAKADAQDRREERRERATQHRAELAVERERHADVEQKKDQREAENEAARRAAQEKQKAERERIEKEAQERRAREKH